MGAKFIILKEDYLYEPNTSMNIMERKLDPNFANSSVEAIEKEFPKALLKMGISNVNFVKIKKDTCQGMLGLYIEYTGDFKEEKMRYIKCFRDNGKSILIITFTIDEREWTEVEPETMGILASVVFND